MQVLMEISFAVHTVLPKGGLTVFTKALALELAPYKVRANCVCPGDIDTPLTRNQFAVMWRKA